MKKKKINLNQLNVKSFVTAVDNNSSVKAKGGARFSVNMTPCSAEPEFCNWTENRWCVSNGGCDTLGGFCTAPL